MTRLENAADMAHTWGVPPADSFLATEVVFIVISGVSTVVMAAVSVSTVVRLTRCLMAYARTVLWPNVAALLVSRRFRSLPASSSMVRLQPGVLGRVSGQVEALTVVRAEYSGVPSVLCRHECGELGGGGAGRGLTVYDFLVRLDDGSTVRVHARDAADRRALSLVDHRPQRWNGRLASWGWYAESRIAVGDKVEVIGRFQREIDTSAPRLGRQPALGWAAVAGPEGLFLCYQTRPLLPAGGAAAMALPQLGS